MKNAKLVSGRFRTRPQDPLELALFWVEAVMNHDGAPYLRSHARTLNFFQYHSLDVMLTILAILALLSYFVCSILRKCVYQIQSKRVSETTSKLTKME
jgi:glucuronosyltransferase